MAVTEWWEENPGCVWQALANLQSPGALHCHKYYMLDACRPCFTQAPSAHSYLHCRHLWFRDGQKLRMAKTRKPGAGLLWETQSLSPTKIQRGQLPHYSGRTLHSRLFHVARLPGWYLSAWEHPQAVYPVDSTIPASFRNRIRPNQLLDAIQESFPISHFSASILLLQCWTPCQHWACPMCQHSHSPWAHRTTCLLHGCPCRESCHCEEALRGASVRCGSTADGREMRNRFGNCWWHVFKKKNMEAMFVLQAGLLESSMLGIRAPAVEWLWLWQVPFLERSPHLHTLLRGWGWWVHSRST